MPPKKRPPETTRNSRSSSSSSVDVKPSNTEAMARQIKAMENQIKLNTKRTEDSSTAMAQILKLSKQMSDLQLNQSKQMAQRVGMVASAQDSNKFPQTQTVELQPRLPFGHEVSHVSLNHAFDPFGGIPSLPSYSAQTTTTETFPFQSPFTSKKVQFRSYITPFSSHSFLCIFVSTHELVLIFLVVWQRC